jgi:hypothetical protein
MAAGFYQSKKREMEGGREGERGEGRKEGRTHVFCNLI